MTDYNLKTYNDKASELNEILVKEHKYEKLIAHLDFNRVQYVSGYMPIEDFVKVCKKYTEGKNVESKWMIKFRFA